MEALVCLVNTRDSVSLRHPNTEKRVFLTKFEVFGWPMKLFAIETKNLDENFRDRTKYRRRLSQASVT